MRWREVSLSTFDEPFTKKSRPMIGKRTTRFFVNGSSTVETETSRQRTPGLPLRREFPFLVGQPEEVRAAYRRAMGLPESGVDARSPAG